jgi:hypothetical protein
MSLFVQSPGGSLKYTFEWTEVIPENVTLENVSYTADGLSIDSSVINNEDATSTIQLGGIQHGGLYVIKAVASLSNSELVPDQQLVIRGFNG